MAATTFNPGFSYAQAAKGRSSAATSQTPSSKVTSGTATPATGTFSELTPGGSWADDVELSVKDKKEEKEKEDLPPPAEEESVQSPPKDVALERAKLEEKPEAIVSVVSSPDITASSNTSTKEDDASTAPNATSSESTWENKSQTSEPAWIAERSQRQNSTLQSEKASKPEKKSKEPSIPNPPKPVVLQDAPPPPENPWAKRAANRAKQAPKPATVLPSPPANTPKQGQKPAAETPVARTPDADAAVDSGPTSTGQGIVSPAVPMNRPSDPRPVVPSQSADSRPVVAKPMATAVSATKPVVNGQPTLPATSPSLPSVNDQASWPTPETAEKAEKSDKARPEASEKDGADKRDEDATPATKRKKQTYAPMAITPTFLYETPIDHKKRGPPNSERPPRTNNGARGGRGGSRMSNGTSHHASSTDSTPAAKQSEDVSAGNQAAEAKDRQAMPPPPRPARASSAGATHDRRRETPAERNPRSLGVSKFQQPGTAIPETGKFEPLSNGSSCKPSNTIQTNGSPEKRTTESNDDELPTPIPRQSSFGTAADGSSTAQPKTPRAQPPIRMVPSESRKDTRPYGENRDPALTGTTRGNKRGGRGRGGARELANGHPSPIYPGNFGADFGAPAFQVPPSPSGHHSSRGNHQYPYPLSARGGWRGANLRAQSIPIDSYHNTRFGVGYQGHPQAQSPYGQQYYPGMYDASGYPMTAVPYAMRPDMQPDMQQLMSMVAFQLEYYFSLDNLLKDTFLRRHMDSQGFVFLDVIANFNRLRQLTSDRELLKAVCMNSDTVEIRVGEDGKERLRKREGWEQFPMKMEDRDPSVQNDGPQRLDRIERPQIAVNNLPSHLRGPASAGFQPMHARLDRRSYDSQYSMMDAYPPNFAGYGEVPQESTNGAFHAEEGRGRSRKSPSQDNGFPLSSSQPPKPATDAELSSDEFPDEQMLMLTVVVRTDEHRPAPHSAASRTFSNGSIDSRHAAPDSEATPSGKSKPLTNGGLHVNGDEDGAKLARITSPSKSIERLPGSHEVKNVFWVKNQDYDITNLPKDLSTYPYFTLRNEALQLRNQAQPHECPRMLRIFYDFLCSFLIRNFNKAMYLEFQQIAHDDIPRRNDSTGLQNLVKFYSQSLASQSVIRDRVIKDYVLLVKDEPSQLDKAAFKSLRSAWRNGALNLKNRKKLADLLDDGLRSQLDQ